MIRDATVFQVLERAAAAWPEREALTAGERRLTYADLLSRTEETAARLGNLGVREGDHVVLWAANLPEWVELQFALARQGAVLVTANTALGPEDLTYLLGDSGAAWLLLGAEARGRDLAAIADRLPRESLPHLRGCRLIEPAPGAGIPLLSELPAGDPGPPVEMARDALVNMQYTSGTTGFPKGVMLSSRNIVDNAWRCGELLGLTPEDRVLCQVPLFHCFGCVVAVLGSFTHGASLHLTRVFDPGASLRVIEREAITVVHGVPTMFQALLDHPEAARARSAPLRTGIMAGSVCPRTLMQRLIEEWGVDEMTVGYGLTECSPHVCYTPRTDPPELRCGTIGIPVDGTEVRLIDAATGTEETRGELQVRGEQVMLGYFGKPDETARTIDAAGWLRTGDLAERDADGRYRIVGRLKEMICRGGENVYPAEVEEALRTVPGVREVAVFGVPDARLGEQVACAVIPHEPDRFSPESLLTDLRGRIAATKIPARVHVVTELPHTASGKVQRFKLTQRFTN